MRQIQEMYDRIAVDLPDSSTMRQIQEMYDRIAMSLPDSSTMRQIQEMYDRIAVDLPDSSTMRQIQEIYDRIAMSLPDSSTMRQIQEMYDRIAMSLPDSSTMRAIREFSNTPFDPVIKEIINDLDALELEQPDTSEYPDFDTDQSIQSEIQRELAGNKDYNGLSNRAKSFLLSIFLQIFINIVSSLIIIPYIQKIQTDLQEKETLAEVRSYVRKPILKINKELLKNHRIVIGSDVHFRKGPSMKSKVITKLSLGELVKVLDKSNRSWLYVEVDIEGEIFVGWVSRRYTTYVK